MTGFTPNQNLPYPQGTDPFAVQTDDTGVPQQQRDLALAINASIGAAPAFIDTRPMFKMSLNGAPTLTIAAGVAFSVPFDTIEVDTGNFCDLSHSAYGPFLALSPGAWVIGGMVSTEPTGSTGGAGRILSGCLLDTASGVIGVGLSAPGGYFDTNDVYDGNGTGVTFLQYSAMFTVVTPTTLVVNPTVQWTWAKSAGGYSGSNATQQKFRYSAMWGYWSGDIT